MIYTDRELQNKCAVEKKGASHEALDQEELSIIKGKFLE